MTDDGKREQMALAAIKKAKNILPRRFIVNGREFCLPFMQTFLMITNLNIW